MTELQLDIQILAIVVAAACALPGVFLVLRKMSMMSDAISHAILFGIVIAFFIVEDLSSPFLVAGAALTGLFTVWVVELFNKSQRVHEDAAIGLVFPLLFSIGVILISRYAGQVHLDVDAVLLGEIAFAPFQRIIIGGWDLGPVATWEMLGILALNALFVVLFYKELKIATFDPALAATLGFSPVILHYALMTMVSFTAVGAFSAVGSILVVALMVGPPATAFLLTQRLSTMILLSVGIGSGSSILGYWFAHWLDVSIAGAIATLIGLVFFVTFLFSPQEGLVFQMWRRRHQRQEFFIDMVLVHLLHHRNTPEEPEECHPGHIAQHLNWDTNTVEKILHKATHRHLVQIQGDLLRLTPDGEARARQRLVE